MEQQKYTLAQFRTLAINGLIKNYFHAKSCMLHVGFQKVRKLYKSLIVDHFYKKKKSQTHKKIGHVYFLTDFNDLYSF